MSASVEAPPEPPPVKIEAPVTRDEIVRILTGTEGMEAKQAGWAYEALIKTGHLVEGVPPCRRVLADAQTFAERTILAELVVRLFRFYILGNIVLPDSPMAMDWLKSYIDGVGHGPLGAGPLRWPRMVPSACKLMTQWGFEATKSDPPFVIKRRQG